MMTFPRSRSKILAGFTLVELLTVMALLSLLFGIIVVSLTGGSEGSRLRMAATELRSAIRFARQHALANSTYCSVVFAYDPTPSTGVELKDPNGKVNLSGLYSSTRPRNQPRLMRAYAVYSARALEGGGGLVTEWKFLPPGLIFDNQQEKANNTGRFNVLYDKECRALVPLSTYSFEPDKTLAQQNSNTAGDEKLFVRVQAITFRPDGTVKFDTLDNATAQSVVYIAEGTNNAEGNSGSTTLSYAYKEPDATKRQVVVLDVYPFTGETLMSMREQYDP